MKIDEMTYGEIKKLAEEMIQAGVISGDVTKHNNSHPFRIGEKYFIRTVTQSYTGLLIAVYTTELLLDKACWIADSGRFHKALLGEWDGSAEHEPFPAQVVIGRGAIIDACPLSCELPVGVK